MKKSPFFSIAIPTYNRAKDLKIALRFILKQTFKDFEVVISDNFSTDNTAKVVKSFKDNRIKYFKTKKHLDVMPSVERSIHLSQGKYVFLQGDDDMLMEKSALFDIYKIIKKTKAGFIRVNYVSVSPDKRHVFDFRASKGYTNDIYLPPDEKNMNVIRFLLHSDPSFLAGIVFRNKIPNEVNLLDSQLYSWFPILFYVTQKWGGFFFSKPLILAGWSQWRVREDNFHSLYSLTDGKLTSENYFKFVKNKVSKAEFAHFLPDQLRRVYVNRFLAIKLNVGNKNLMKLAIRLRNLTPEFSRELSFWTGLLISFVTPRLILTHIRSIYLRIYIERSNLDSKYNIEEILKNNET